MMSISASENDADGSDSRNCAPFPDGRGRTGRACKLFPTRSFGFDLAVTTSTTGTVNGLVLASRDPTGPSTCTIHEVSEASRCVSLKPLDMVGNIRSGDTVLRYRPQALARHLLGGNEQRQLRGQRNRHPEAT